MALVREISSASGEHATEAQAQVSPSPFLGTLYYTMLYYTRLYQTLQYTILSLFRGFWDQSPKGAVCGSRSPRAGRGLRALGGPHSGPKRI